MRFSVGQVLATGFGTFARRYGPLFVLVVLTYATIVAFSLPFDIGPLHPFLNDIVERLGRIHPVLGLHTIKLDWVPLSLLSAAIAIYVVGRLRDEPVNYGLYYVVFQFLVLRSANIWERYKLFAWVWFGIGIVLAALLPVIVAVTYEKLRISKEGPAGNQLQRVFD